MMSGSFQFIYHTSINWFWSNKENSWLSCFSNLKSCKLIRKWKIFLAAIRHARSRFFETVKTTAFCNQFPSARPVCWRIGYSLMSNKCFPIFLATGFLPKLYFVFSPLFFFVKYFFVNIFFSRQVPVGWSDFIVTRASRGFRTPRSRSAKWWAPGARRCPPASWRAARYLIFLGYFREKSGGIRI